MTTEAETPAETPTETDLNLHQIVKGKRLLIEAAAPRLQGLTEWLKKELDTVPRVNFTKNENYLKGQASIVREGGEMAFNLFYSYAEERYVVVAIFNGKPVFQLLIEKEDDEAAVETKQLAFLNQIAALFI